MSVNILLVGKTGNGKSSTGNSILGGEKKFLAKRSSCSVTQQVQIAQKYLGKCRVTLVDTVGYADTDTDENNFITANYKLIKSQVEEALKRCPAGFHAIIYVITAKDRVKREDEDAFHCITSVLGKNNFRNFGILLFTYGDLYLRENKDMHILDWCKNEQKLRPFLLQCNNRVILFNNRQSEKLTTQRNELFDVIRNMHSREMSVLYSIDSFMDGAKDRKFFEVEAIKEQIQTKVDETIHRIKSKMLEFGDSFIVENANIFLEIIDKEIKSVSTQDEETGILDSQLSQLKLLKCDIENSIPKSRFETESEKPQASTRQMQETEQFVNRMKQEVETAMENRQTLLNARYQLRQAELRRRKWEAIANIGLGVFNFAIDIGHMIIDRT